MAYGHLGQQSTGTTRSSSPNPKPAKGGTPPEQTMRGYGPVKSTNATSRGTKPAPVQKVRGFRQTNAKTPSTTNTSAGRIKKGRA